MQRFRRVCRQWRDVVDELLCKSVDADAKNRRWLSVCKEALSKNICLETLHQVISLDILALFEFLGCSHWLC